MEKIALILIYNILFVTKKIFFRNEHQKIFLTCTFLVDPVEWRQTKIFLSLTWFCFFIFFSKAKSKNLIFNFMWYYTTTNWFSIMCKLLVNLEKPWSMMQFILFVIFKDAIEFIFLKKVWCTTMSTFTFIKNLYSRYLLKKIGNVCIYILKQPALFMTFTKLIICFLGC